MSKDRIKVGDKVRIKETGDEGVVSHLKISSVGHTLFLLSGGPFDEDYVFYDVDLEKIEESEGGLKYDNGKPDLSLVDRSLVEAAARALMFGANKYGRDNYKKGIALERIYASLLRHIFARMSGEFKDPESGLDHLDHIAGNVQFLTYFTSIERLGDVND